MPQRSKILDANLMEWINVMIRGLCVAFLWLRVCKDEITYSIYHIKQILKLYFHILPITEVIQTERDSNNWKL